MKQTNEGRRKQWNSKKKKWYSTEIGDLHTAPTEERLAEKRNAYRSVCRHQQLPKMPFPSNYRQKYPRALLINTSLIYFIFHFLIYTTNSFIFKLFITIGLNSNHIYPYIYIYIYIPSPPNLIYHLGKPMKCQNLNTQQHNLDHIKKIIFPTF